MSTSGSDEEPPAPRWNCVRVLSLCAGLAASALGVLSVIALSPLCVAAGVWLVAAGFAVAAAEVPGIYQAICSGRR